MALDAKAGLAPTAPLDVTLAIADLDAGDALAEDARLTLKGPLTDASVRLTARGEAADEPLEADLEGRLAVTDAGQRFRLTAGKGAVAGAPFTLASGLEVRINAGGFAVTSLALASKPLTLEADAALGDRGVDLDLRKAEADLGALADLVPGMPVTGVATASGRIQGPLSAPSGRIDMVGRDLHAAEAPDGTVVQIEGALTLAPDRLGVDISATGLGETPLTVKGGVGLAGGGDGPPAPTLASPTRLSRNARSSAANSRAVGYRSAAVRAMARSQIAASAGGAVRAQIASAVGGPWRTSSGVAVSACPAYGGRRVSR